VVANGRLRARGTLDLRGVDAAGRDLQMFTGAPAAYCESAILVERREAGSQEAVQP
jgi:hypothetical protein